jgi:uncharacterized membrane protein
MGKWIAVHRKAITAVAGAAVAFAVAQWGTGNHWVTLAVMLLSALGVYAVPNG